MSTGEPEAKRDEAKPRERRRLKLIESYGAFSDDRLQEVAQKIRGITSDNDPQPAVPKREAPLSSGEITESITESITQWITQCPLGETESVKEKQGVETAKLISTNPHIFTPNGSPDGSPNESSDDSPDTPNGSPDGSPNESSDDTPNGSPNESSDDTPNGSPNESPN